MHKLMIASALLVATVATASAQLSVGASPNPAPVGTQIFLTAEATVPTELLRECPTEIRSGSPTGPIVVTPLRCTFIRPVLGPGAPFGGTRALFGWNGMDSTNNPAAPGHYFIRVEHKPLNSSQPFATHWVPVRLDPATGPTEPVLSALSAFTRGQTTGVQVSSPTQPGKAFAIAASLTTNTGFATSFGHIALDNDGLLIASLLQVSPPFTNFQSTLDASGDGVGAIAIPNIPALQGQNIAFQAITIDGPTIMRTNAITGIIQ